METTLLYQESKAKGSRLLTTAMNYCIFDTPRTQNERMSVFHEFMQGVDSAPPATLAELVKAAANNRIIKLLQELTSEKTAETPNLNLLRRYIKETLDQELSLKAKRDQIVMKLVSVLSKYSIDYVLFKTFNRFGGVGVDIDLLIRKQDYFKFVGAMKGGGFASIDDISKTYATGFMEEKGGNPIIVDLHTDIAILGVSYFSPNTIFANKIEREISLTGGVGERHTTMKLNMLNDKTSAVVAMAHSVIKESSIKASDLLEVSQAILADKESYVSRVKSERLGTANEIFMASLEGLLPRARPTFKEEPSSFFSKVAMSFVSKTLDQGVNLPVKIPFQSSALAFFETVRERNELGQSLPKAIASIRYGRNLARAGQKLMSPFGL